jgi:hypothetical protein
METVQSLEIYAECDRAGMTVAQTARHVGVSKRTVIYKRQELRKAGVVLNRSWSDLRRNAPAMSAGPMPDDDEEMDYDEPVFVGPIQRCKCGLTVPCHACTDAVRIALDAPARAEYLMQSDPPGSYLPGKRYSDGKKQPVTFPFKGRRMTAARMPKDAAYGRLDT